MTQLIASNTTLYTEGGDDMLTMGTYDMVILHAMFFHSAINTLPLKATTNIELHW
jgi:hypothetical protein